MGISSYVLILFSLIAVSAIALVFVAVLYNQLVRDRNRVNSAWSDIDVQLQRRHDLIPRLVAAVDQYANYERATFEAVSALRSQAMRISDINGRGEAEQRLGEGVLKIVALAEQYPELKANENFLELQNDLVETENYLQFARRFYNGSVRQYNTRVETVPANLVASMFGFREREYFQKSADEVASVPLIDLGTVE